MQEHNTYFGGRADEGASQQLAKTRRPRVLISLRAACARRGISVRTYWRDTSLLPQPVRGRGKHLFLEEEIDQYIDGLLEKRRVEFETQNR